MNNFGFVVLVSQAFRYLSHKFHGKIPGKMKTEKRSKKIQEEAVSLQFVVELKIEICVLLWDFLDSSFFVSPHRCCRK